MLDKLRVSTLTATLPDGRRGARADERLRRGHGAERGPAALERARQAGRGRPGPLTGRAGLPVLARVVHPVPAGDARGPDLRLRRRAAHGPPGTAALGRADGPVRAVGAPTRCSAGPRSSTPTGWPWRSSSATSTTTSTGAGWRSDARTTATGAGADLRRGRHRRAQRRGRVDHGRPRLPERGWLRLRGDSGTERAARAGSARRCSSSAATGCCCAS